MYSINPIQERKDQITKSISGSFQQSTIKIQETPGNPVENLKHFVSNNIVKSITGEDIEKSMGGSKGEGSRGGKVIGHTSSGKPIYADLSAKDHKGFTPGDHRDAADFYHSQALNGGIMFRFSKFKRNDHHTLAEKGGNSLKEREKKSVEEGDKKANSGKTTKEPETIKNDDDPSSKYLSDAKKKAQAMSGKELINKRDYHEASMKDYSDKNNADYKYHEAHAAMYKEALNKVADRGGAKKTAIKKSEDNDFIEDINNDISYKSLDYEQDDRDVIRKGEIMEKFGMGYGGSNALTFTKTGKELKEVLPTVIANLNAKKDALETLMSAYQKTAGIDPTEPYQSYNIKSIICKRYPYNLINTYNSSSNSYSEPTDEQKAMTTYNDCCYAWQSLSEDIAACKVIKDNLEDNKKYTLSVSQLIALSLGE